MRYIDVKNFTMLAQISYWLSSSHGVNIETINPDGLDLEKQQEYLYFQRT